MTDAEKQIREAAAEMRPGEWRVSKHHESRYMLIYDADGFEVTRVCYPNRDANAAFIIACNPAAIAALLADLDAVRIENAKLADREAALRAEVDALRADAERLSSLAYPPFCDEYNEVDLHEQAAIYASAFGREEPNRDDYLAALRDAVDAALAQAKE